MQDVSNEVTNAQVVAAADSLLSKLESYHAEGVAIQDVNRMNVQSTDDRYFFRYEVCHNSEFLSKLFFVLITRFGRRMASSISRM